MSTHISSSSHRTLWIDHVQASDALPDAVASLESLRVTSLRFCKPEVSDAANEKDANEEQADDANGHDVCLPRQWIDDDFWIDFTDESIALCALVKLHLAVDENCALVNEIIVLNPHLFCISVEWLNDDEGLMIS
jgi:hypothetical protein